MLAEHEGACSDSCRLSDCRVGSSLHRAKQAARAYHRRLPSPWLWLFDLVSGQQLRLQQLYLDTHPSVA